MKSLSLRARLTFLTIGLVIVLAAILTFSSVYNAGNIFGEAEVGNNPISPPEMESTAYEDDTTVVFRNVSVLLMFGVIAIGGILAYLVVGAALRPMRELNRQIQSVSGNSLNSRIEGFKTSDEVSQLAASFNEMLGRLDEAFNTQKRFASSAAHELKTPLAAIKTNLDVLTVGKAAEIEEYEEVYTVIQKQTERMTKLVDSLLATSASESYALDDTVKLSKMVHDILTEQRADIEEKRILVNFNCQEPIQIKANSTMLYRALANLVENAVKYNTNQGKLDISLSRQGHTVNLHISNTGLGIAPEHLPYIFEPFYRVDDSRSRKIAGAGLGLAIVKDTIERHSGKVAIESDGNGVTCHVWLPNIHAKNS